MNKFCFFFLFLSASSVFAQKNIIVLDKFSKKPIENVTVSFSKTAGGTFTNSDGKAIVSPTEETLKLTHLNYRDTTITLKSNGSLDSVLLLPKAIELHQVSISSFNMRKSLNYILDHYQELYVNVPTAKECTFKESFLINNQYKRLILSQIEWWSKSAAHPMDIDQWYGNYSKFVKVKLGNIDFYRNDPMGIFDSGEKEEDASKSRYLDTKTLINNLYFNYVLHIILSYPKDIHSTIEDSPAGQLAVSFETEPKQSEGISSIARGKIVFDKATKAIIEYRDSTEFVGNIDQRKDVNGGSYIYEQKQVIANYSFDKSINNKWSLKRCEFHVESIIDYKGKKSPVVFENSLYVLKEAEVKKVNNKGVIDLDKSIYHNFPTETVINSNPILLTNTEQAFINKPLSR